MRLEQRLRMLRGEIQQPVSPPRQDDLAQRLRRLACGTRRQSPSRVPDEQALAVSIGAQRIAPGVLRTERRFALDALHGQVRLGDFLPALPDLMEEPVGHPGSWLFLDTETSGLAGGTGTWAFLCGLLRPGGQGLVLRQYLLARLDAERAYLEAIAAELQTAHLLVTYNGKSFDAPLLSTRLRLVGLASNLEDKRHLDLLHPMRRAFASIWPDCRLATAEDRLLGFSRKDDLPGAEAPAAWLAWLRRGEVDGLAAVLEHNCWDLLTLPALVRPLRQSFVDPAATGSDIHSIARFHLSRGDADLALKLLLANRDKIAPSALLELARLHRRRGEWAAAGTIWEALAEQGIPEAVEAHVKYLEHREGDYLRALQWVDRLPRGPACEHRRCRLENKLRATSPKLERVAAA